MERDELLNVVKLSLRVTAEEYDPEVEMLVDGAVADMERVGVDPAVIEALEPLVVQAVVTYAKARFGFDNDDKAFFDEAYRQHVCDLLNSSANIAACEEGM